MTTIDEVLHELEEIIHYSIENNHRAGYFAALYYKVTAKVKAGIIAGEFEDGARMEKLDVLFAQRYIDAYHKWRKGEPITGSWKVAFESSSKRSVLALQHLLLGINAHINLDLGIAATLTAQDTDIKAIFRDFKSINDVIASLTYGVINDLRLISPFLSVLGLSAANSNSMLIQFSISSARDGAWVFAQELMDKKGNEYEECIAARDGQINRLGNDLAHVKGFMKLGVWVIRLFEKKNIGRNIEILHTNKKKKWHETLEGEKH
jgi:hypothetical protein